MAQEVKGDIKGLSPSEKKNLHRLFSRRFGKSELVSLDFAREIYGLAAHLSRRIGVLVSREGVIEEVFVGSREILYLPDLGRYRLGAGRLRRLRLIYSDLSSASDKVVIPTDIYTDLAKLRLDAVVGVKDVGKRVLTGFAHISPRRDDDALNTHTEQVADLGQLRLDFTELMQNLESELGRETAKAVPTGKTPAVLIGVYDKRFPNYESSMIELNELARTAGVHVVESIIQRRTPDPKTVLGTGKLEEVVLRCLRLGADMLIFDQELKPSQWRAITNATELKVIDRSMLILDIFAQRAKSSDGRLQVELAQLKYNLPRLVEKDAGLSRLSGGIGGRGPGETKLEIGRRRIRDRISDLEKRIGRLSSQRDLRRQRRKEHGLPLVSILGYTNAGKSTLFNVLTKSDVLSEDKLFATLDPAQRRLVLPPPDDNTQYPGDVVVLSDTVGFIRSLPAELKNAFRATLEELYDAALLIHVVDGSDPEAIEKMEAVDAILGEMDLTNLDQILVYNKKDKMSEEAARALELHAPGLFVSSVSKEGLQELLVKIRNKLAERQGRLARQAAVEKAALEADSF